MFILNLTSDTFQKNLASSQIFSTIGAIYIFPGGEQFFLGQFFLKSINTIEDSIDTKNSLKWKSFFQFFLDNWVILKKSPKSCF